MGKQILQKIIAAIIASAVIVVLAVFSFPMLITDLQLSDGTLVTAETLFNVKGASSYFVLLFVVSVIVTLVTLLVGSNRRRRARMGGTMVESDTNDGRERGTVKWFNMKKGFGFITWERGKGQEEDRKSTRLNSSHVRI